MTRQQAIQLFEERKVRTVWDDETLYKVENETVTNCHQLKLEAADGKIRMAIAVAAS